MSVPSSRKPITAGMNSRAHGQWRPLFTGHEAQVYRGVARQIAVSLADPAVMGTDSSLASGQSGTALLFAYRHLVTGVNQDLKDALSHLSSALENAAAVPNWIGLFGGLTGVGYAATFLHRRLLGSNDDDPVGEIDEVVGSLLTVPRWEGDYDLISGLVGLGVYALERLPDRRAKRNLVRIIDHLEVCATYQEQGVAWWTPPEKLPDNQRVTAPKGYFNLGVAHGVPGVIALLGNAVQVGIRVDKSRQLLAQAVEWLLSRQLPVGSASFYPAWVGGGRGQDQPSRTAWCYGDLGLAAVLLSVARMVGESAWESEAMKIALHAASVPPEKSGVVDPGLCHGAAGVAHLFNRMYQATSEEVFGAAARFWFRDTLTRRRPGAEAAGICSYSPVAAKQGRSPWRTSRGFLEGAAGIAMALMAATSSQEPVWDDVLLVGTRQGVSGETFVD